MELFETTKSRDVPSDTDEMLWVGLVGKYETGYISVMLYMFMYSMGSGCIAPCWCAAITVQNERLQPANKPCKENIWSSTGCSLPSRRVAVVGLEAYAVQTMTGVEIGRAHV